MPSWYLQHRCWRRGRDVWQTFHEVLLSVPEEEEDQAEILRSIAAALLQEVRGGGQSLVIEEEGATLHYLYHTLTLMRYASTTTSHSHHG